MTASTQSVFEETALPTASTAATKVIEETQEPTEMPTEMPTEPPTEPVAERIPDGFEILIDGGKCTRYLKDFDYKTKKTIQPNQVLSIESTTAFAGVYLEWDIVPGVYSVVWDGGSIECGQNGFLHEFVRLPVPVYEVKFEFASDEAQILCDVALLTEGVAPEEIQNWSLPYDQADILVFPTHSDDDTLFFGPLISYYTVERELCVQTAFMVHHKGQTYRDHERLNGLWAMGVRHYPILGTAPDTGTYSMYEAMRYYASSDIEQWQVEQIRRLKPLVVVGHDLNGEYGNGGHKVNAYYLVRAIESAADPLLFPESADQFGVWDTPKLYLHLYEENEILLDVNTPLENDPEGRTPFQLAEAGYECHISQHQYGFYVQQGKNRVYDCRPFGLYRTLVGYDTVADIMENIDIQQWRNPVN